MHSVLVVDDDDALRRVVRDWVDAADGFRGREADSSEDALVAMRREPADIALCEANMGGWNGVWLATQIRRMYPQTAIIMVASQRDVDTAIAGLQNDVVDYLLKPFDRTGLQEALLLARDWHCASAGVDDLQQALHDRMRSRRASLAAALSEAQETQLGAMESLISMLQLHERDGRGHALRVARLAVAIGEELGLTDDEIEVLERGALLHDIGKLDMPRSILAKPAPLDDHEWQVMRRHPQVGYDLLKNQQRFADAAQIVLSHHEAFDGSGYPRQLQGEDIPLGARVLTVADAYDSMTQPHTQRPPMPPALAVQEIERCSGRQFDPDCAQALGPVLAHAVEEHAA
ncbi:MAG TPA: HD domain-containing phosphohydrolase [Vicinamibacterales bacterium]|nr:HD domain-containing phosphohydrolase [Vicinamibacterales bacterium]